ncbi:DUF2817 domain-containing protein [Gemmatimonadota bacterium]
MLTGALCRFFPSVLSVAIVALPTLGESASAQSTSQEWLEAPAESVEYQEGGTLYGPLMDFVYELESRTELLSVVKLTETLGGRDLVLAVLSNPPVFRPEDLAFSEKPIVLIVNNVHGGEVAGKDAAMEIMRDLVMGDLRPLLDEVVVLVVPTINPDGAEVRRRTNEEGFDMNRDYIKLESQEIQALLTQVIHEWHPHIHLDTHHGGAAPYTLTYQTNMNPAGDENLTRFGNERILPEVRRALRSEAYEGFWYSGPSTVNGVEGWGPTSVEPRKQHVYSTLANMVGFLYETPSGSHRVVENGTRVIPIPEEERYRHQVRGQYLGQRALIQFAAQNAQELVGVVAQARADAIARGNDDSDNDLIPIEYEQVANFTDSFWRRVGGGGRPAFGEDVEYELVEGPVFTKWEPTRTAVRPWGYLLPPSLTKVVPLLLQHDITVKQLTEPVEVEVEVYSATEITHAEYFQAHYLKALKAEKSTETVSLPVGSFFVPSGQPMSNFISYIMEPETNDNLITWGYLDNVLRVTPTQEEVAAQRAQLEERLAGMTAQERQQMGARMEAQLRQLTRGQEIPIYRLMKKTHLPGVLVRAFNEYEARRYIR